MLTTDPSINTVLVFLLCIKEIGSRRSCVHEFSVHILTCKPVCILLSRSDVPLYYVLVLISEYVFDEVVVGPCKTMWGLHSPFTYRNCTCNSFVDENK
jgi:hypothetical protein